MFNRIKILTSFFILIFYSCGNDNILFIDYVDVNGSWEKENEIKFSFESDTAILGDLSLIIRNDSSYPFSNIYMITSIKNNNTITRDTINYSFENNNTKWYELRSSGINSSIIPIKNSFKISPGQFEFNVKHSIRYLDSIMPQIKLDGILDVGLVIEKTIK